MTPPRETWIAVPSAVASSWPRAPLIEIAGSAASGLLLAALPVATCCSITAIVPRPRPYSTTAALLSPVWIRRTALRGSPTSEPGADSRNGSAAATAAVPVAVLPEWLFMPLTELLVGSLTLTGLIEAGACTARSLPEMAP